MLYGELQTETIKKKNTPNFVAITVCRIMKYLRKVGLCPQSQPMYTSLY
jgi:hypothetical protein